MEDDGNFVVDCDILEKAKENIQPLAGGRSATALASVLKTPHARRDGQLAATKARLRERVQEAKETLELVAARNEAGECEQENDDELSIEEAEEVLLSAYVQLVTWTVEHYPRGQSVESGILELLEEATRVMRHSNYAKADARYLNLWLRYASYVDKPEVIFEFLLANEIGTACAKLYEDYAIILEKANRRTKADEIYQLGINRNAEPQDHLKKRHVDFQKRMMVAASNPSAQQDIPASSIYSAPASTAPKRKILGDSTSFPTSSSIASTSTSTSSSQRSALASNASSRGDVFSASAPTSASTSSTSTSTSASSITTTHPNARMAVFVDPSGANAEASSRSAWPELGTRKERVKENVRAAEKMEGAVLKQRGAAKAATREAGARARGAPKIVPFRDPEPAAAAPPPQPAPAPSRIRNGTTRKASGKPVIVPFVDDNEGTEEPAKTVTTATTQQPTKFIPFKDPQGDESPVTSTSSLPVPDSVMRPKALGGSSPVALSEAEALRKDPFKNYKDEDV